MDIWDQKNDLLELIPYKNSIVDSFCGKNWAFCANLILGVYYPPRLSYFENEIDVTSGGIKGGMGASEALSPPTFPTVRRKKLSKSAIFGKFLDFCPLIMHQSLSPQCPLSEALPTTFPWSEEKKIVKISHFGQILGFLPRHFVASMPPPKKKFWCRHWMSLQSLC